jgi:hypothetical protein
MTATRRSECVLGEIQIVKEATARFSISVCVIAHYMKAIPHGDQSFPVIDFFWK